MYDFCIVGAGISGCVLARELTNKGYTCLVVDKNNYLGGLCHTTKEKDIIIHEFSSHTFNTTNKNIWDYLNKYTTVKPYKHIRRAYYKGKFYSFPPNLLTVQQLFPNINTPEKAQKNIFKIQDKIEKIFFKEFSEKQWGMNYQEIPKNFMARVPIRINFNDNYYSDMCWQGMPDYELLFKNLLDKIDVSLNTEINAIDKSMYKWLIYTGSVDELYRYNLGKLKYRSLRFEKKYLDIPEFQGCATVSYPEKKYQWTKIIEHKYLTNIKCNYTIITYDIPCKDGIKMYPILTPENIKLYEAYKKQADKDKIILAGRLGKYKYMNMDECINEAIQIASYVKNFTA